MGVFYSREGRIMNILAPSILSADFKNLGRDITDIERGGAEYVHIDVMDGMFVPSISFGMPVIASIRNVSNIVFDVHLMIEEPIRYIKEFKECGADIITVHLEACSDVRATLEAVRAEGLKAGLSIKPATDVEEVRPYLDVCDMILLMSVEPGFGGQKFIENTIKKAQQLRQLIAQHDSHALIEVDGGVQGETAPRLVKAGADVLVSGSYVFKSATPEDTIRSLRNL